MREQEKAQDRVKDVHDCYMKKYWLEKNLGKEQKKAAERWRVLNYENRQVLQDKKRDSATK